jgi:hypothetical protein
MTRNYKERLKVYVCYVELRSVGEVENSFIYSQFRNKRMKDQIKACTDVYRCVCVIILNRKQTDSSVGLTLAFICLKNFITKFCV